MSPTIEDHWDFTPVLKLLTSLSIGGQELTEEKAISRDALPRDTTDRIIQGNGLDQETQLGDFDRIWQYLGQPLNVPPPQVPPGPNVEIIEVSENTGSVEHPRLKAVKWRDELEGADLADNDEGKDMQDLSGSNKKQKKKAKRKQRREALAAGITNMANLPGGSDNESEKESKAPRTPDSKAVICQILHGNTPKKTSLEGVASRLRSGKVYKFQDSLELEKWQVASPQPSVREAMKILRPLRESPRENAYAVAAAKKTKLIALLFETFIDERQYLTNNSFTHHVNSNTDATEDGIHVFVDASNVRFLPSSHLILPPNKANR